MRFSQVGAVMLLVFSEQYPSDDEWAEWLNAYARGVRERGVRGLLAVSLGGIPKTHQRKQLNTFGLCEQLGSEDLKTVVCSRSRSVRTVTNAIGWFFAMSYVKSLGYAQRREALLYLNVPEEQWGDILDLLRRYEHEVKRAV